MADCDAFGSREVAGVAVAWVVADVDDVDVELVSSSFPEIASLLFRDTLSVPTTSQ